EATDNGQVVDDASLADQAIFERLEQDIVFRSVATRLLQRYGYLLPAANPDSDLGKEKELVLKERARRLVQIESQEDSESLRPQANNRELEQTAACDPKTDEDCLQPSPAQPRQRSRTQVDTSSPRTSPRAVPEQLPQQSVPRLLQTEGLPQPLDLRDDSLSSSGLQLTSTPGARNRNPLEGASSLGAGAIDESPVAQNLAALIREKAGANEPAVQPNETGRPRRAATYRGRVSEEDVTPVKMSHRANPYADIPSLYDMYVQASVRQKPTERFGLDVFR